MVATTVNVPQLDGPKASLDGEIARVDTRLRRGYLTLLFVRYDCLVFLLGGRHTPSNRTVGVGLGDVKFESRSCSSWEPSPKLVVESSVEIDRLSVVVDGVHFCFSVRCRD